MIRLAIFGCLTFTSLGFGQGRAPVDDPNQDGWSTESLHSEASDKLARIADLMPDFQPQAMEKLTSFLSSAEFTCGRLRPQEKRTLFSDRVMEVTQGITFDKQTSPGSTGLVQSLRELVPPTATHVRAKFKIFRIQRENDVVQTRQFLELTCRSSNETHQLNLVCDSRWQKREQLELQSLVARQYEEIVTNDAKRTLFEDCTEFVFGANESYRKQLVYSLDHWDDRLLQVDTEGHQGLAIGDVNGDGLEDLYLTQTAPLPNRLFVQQPDGTVIDKSAEYEVDWHEPSRSALFSDLDNDGDQDLVVATTSALLILENIREQKFVLRRKILQAQNAYSLAASDYDLDGDLDIFASVYLARARSRQVLAAPVPFHDARNGGRNVLLRNDGTWRFQDVTKQAGLEEEATRRSFACSWEDYDNDGDMDLYVANDYGRNNLFRNENGRFVDVAKAAGVEDQSFGMSVTWGDFNRDGWMDLYVSNMFSAAGNRIAFQRNFRNSDDAELRKKFQYLARGNSLFLNAGDGTFKDVSKNASVLRGDWSWGSEFVDLNNDGFKDLVVANGFLTRRNPNDL